MENKPKQSKFLVNISAYSIIVLFVMGVFKLIFWGDGGMAELKPIRDFLNSSYYNVIMLIALAVFGITFIIALYKRSKIVTYDKQQKEEQ